jgi:hypothetical protein
MISCEPSVSISALVTATPGSLVRFEGAFGFVVVSENDPAPNPVRRIATYNRTTHRFERAMPEGVEVFDFGSTLVLEPDLESVSEGELPSEESGSEALLVGKEFNVVVHLSRTQFRLLELSTGVLKALNPPPLLKAFKRWSIGVRDARGRYTPLIVATPRLAAAVDEGPIGP